MTLDFSYFGIQIPLSNLSCRKQTGIPMCLTLGVNISASTKETKLVLYSQCTVGVPIWSFKAYMYLWIVFVIFTYLYMHIISPSVESDSIAGRICTFHHTSTPIIVCIIPETDRRMLIIIAWCAYL